jgi:hypothetical protein
METEDKIKENNNEGGSLNAFISFVCVLGIIRTIIGYFTECIRYSTYNDQYEWTFYNYIGSICYNGMYRGFYYSTI